MAVVHSAVAPLLPSSLSTSVPAENVWKENWGGGEINGGADQVELAEVRKG